MLDFCTSTGWMEGKPCHFHEWTEEPASLWTDNSWPGSSIVVWSVKPQQTSVWNRQLWAGNERWHVISLLFVKKSLQLSYKWDDNTFWRFGFLNNQIGWTRSLFISWDWKCCSASRLHFEFFLGWGKLPQGQSGLELRCWGKTGESSTAYYQGVNLCVPCFWGGQSSMRGLLSHTDHSAPQGQLLLLISIFLCTGAKPISMFNTAFLSSLHSWPFLRCLNAGCIFLSVGEEPFLFRAIYFDYHHRWKQTDQYSRCSRGGKISNFFF